MRPLKHCGASWCVIGLWWASLELYDYRGVTQPGWFGFRVGFNPGDRVRAAPFRDSSYGAWEGSNGVMCSAITSRGVLAIVLAIDYGKLDAAESWWCGAVR